MRRIMIVARKEFRELLSERNTLLIALAMTLFFSIVYSFGAARQESPLGSTGGVVLFLSSAIGVFMAYMLTGRIFFREKVDRVIETLMCAPVSIRELWAGKAVSVTGMAWGLTLLGTAVMLAITGTLSGTMPSISLLIFYVLISIPVLIFAFVGLLGFAQFFLGMRENRIISMLIFIPIFGALYGVGYGIGGSITISWAIIVIILGISLILVLVASFSLRYLSKERIVKTLS
jgi:ABC-2 type transport system permease protein